MSQVLTPLLLGWSLAQLLLFWIVNLDVDGAGGVIMRAADARLALVMLSFSLGGLMAIACTATALCLMDPLSAPGQRRP